MTTDRIPLLSGKPLKEMSPEEFKKSVLKLYHKPEPEKKEPKPFSFFLNKKGTVVLRINREPKWITEEELESIAKESNTSIDDLIKKVEKAKIKLITKEDKNQLTLF